MSKLQYNVSTIWSEKDKSDHCSTISFSMPLGEWRKIEKSFIWRLFTKTSPRKSKEHEIKMDAKQEAMYRDVGAVRSILAKVIKNQEIILRLHAAEILLLGVIAITVIYNIVIG